MITENSVVTEPGCNPHYQPRFCWSAVFAGAFVGVGLGFLLHLFGMAIGLSAYNASPDGSSAMALGSVFGMFICVIISMGAAGQVAGILGRTNYTHCRGGIIYGLVTWSMSLLLGAILILPVAHYLSVYSRALNPTEVVTISNTETTEAAATNDTAPAATKQKVAPQGTTTVTPDMLSKGAWLVFLLFFIGAIASSVGACHGLRGCRRHKHINPNTTPL